LYRAKFCIVSNDNISNNNISNNKYNIITITLKFTENMNIYFTKRIKNFYSLIYKKIYSKRTYNAKFATQITLYLNRNQISKIDLVH